MKRAKRISVLKSSRGAAVVEMALVLPILLLLFFGVFEVWQGIRANNVIVNISREGANIASRTSGDLQDIMNTVAGTASLPDMKENGTVYITRMVGIAGNKFEVREQVRWSESTWDSSSVSEFYDCGGDWDGHSCDLGSKPPEKKSKEVLNMELDVGETVYGVEVLYNYQPVFEYVIPEDIILYTATVL